MRFGALGGHCGVGVRRQFRGEQHLQIGVLRLELLLLGRELGLQRNLVRSLGHDSGGVSLSGHWRLSFLLGFGLGVRGGRFWRRVGRHVIDDDAAGDVTVDTGGNSGGRSGSDSRRLVGGGGGSGGCHRSGGNGGHRSRVHCRAHRGHVGVVRHSRGAAGDVLVAIRFIAHLVELLAQHPDVIGKRLIRLGHHLKALENLGQHVPAVRSGIVSNSVCRRGRCGARIHVFSTHECTTS